MPLDLSAADAWAMSPEAQEAQEAFAQAAKTDKTIGKMPYIVMSGGQLADLLSTVHGLQQPGMKEGNPMMGQHPARIAAMKGAGAAAMGGLMHHADKQGKDTLAKAIGYSTGLLGAALAAYNLRQLQKVKGRK